MHLRTLATVLCLAIAAAPVTVFAGKPAPAPAPAFVPAIAYVQMKSSGIYDLMVMNTAGTATKKLLAGTSSFLPRAPRFSPDGTKIVFLAANALWVVPAAGGTQWKLVDLVHGASSDTPSWSPDGRFILYSDLAQPSTSCSCDDSDLFLVEVDDTGHVIPGSNVRLTNTPATGELRPSWSRDGSRFSAMKWINNSEKQLFLFDFDAATRSITNSWSLTGPLGKLSFGPDVPRWNHSPTSFGSDVILFSAQIPGSGTYFDLWFVDTATLRSGRLIVAPGHSTDGAFSPDDARIAYVDRRKGSQIRIIQNGGDLIRETATAAVTTTTAAVTTKAVFDLVDVDWNPVP